MFNHRTIAALTAVAALTGGAAASAATPAPGGLGNATLGSVFQSEQAKIAAITAVPASGAGAPADTPAAGSPSNAAIGSLSPINQANNGRLSNAPIGSLSQNKQVNVGGLSNAPIGSLSQNKQVNVGGLSNAPIGSVIQQEQAKAAALAAYNAGGTNCRAWHVNGQTWFASQGRYITLMFTLKTASPTSSLFSPQSYAAFSRGLAHTQLFTRSVPDTGAGSQYIGGALNSNTGSIHMDIVWKNGDSGQYDGTAYDVQRTRAGGLTALLHGTTVDTARSGASASWEADGMSGIPYFGEGDYTRPLYCKPGDVVR